MDCLNSYVKYVVPTNIMFDFHGVLVLETNCVKKINASNFHREIFELDNYSPIPVETEEEYKLVISRFPFHDAEIEKVRNIKTTVLL